MNNNQGPNPILREIADLAYENYTAAEDVIHEMQEQIDSNRKGETELSAIHQKDPERLSNRMARTNASGAEALERINGVANFQDINILDKIHGLSEAVCRINIRSQYGNSGHGTGCLIAPNLIITNNHVFPDPTTAQYSIAEFDYELDSRGNRITSHSFNLRPDLFFMTSSYKKTGQQFSGLDFTVVAVQERARSGKRIGEYEHAKLDQNVGKIIDGEGCVIIQHPKGDFKKIVLKDIRLLTAKEDVLIYESDTLPGSSGSIVVGLGTGEIVALHHSGVPRKNSRGQWLRKDGRVAGPNDPDNMIDWIGNEGIRISRILNAIANMSLDGSMTDLRNSIFGDSTIISVPRAVIDSPGPSSGEQSGPASPGVQPTAPVQPSVSSSSGSSSATNGYTSLGSELAFEIQLSSLPEMQDDWRESAKALIPDLVSSEALFPLSTVPEHKRLHYIRVASHENPWVLAEQIEKLPQVDTCTPDIPAETDAVAGSSLPWSTSNESVFESLNDGVADWHDSETDFITRWGNSHYVEPHVGPDKDPKGFRQWNRSSVSMPDNPATLSHWQQISDQLNNISIVQLDTGYTDHQKVFGGFDLTKDEDFIDGEDARDELATGILRHPAHGTRTASLIIGGNMSGTFKHDGNTGLLYDGTARAGQVIPYRVSRSVVLIGRGKNVFDAAAEAINIEADVMFMCMGSYPRPMLYEIAKRVYEKGIIWLCAAGNEVEMVVAPAMYPGTIAIGAVNPFDRPWRGSSYGTTVDICAPGEDVYVPFKDRKGNDIMVFGSGTSYATPHVASAAAMWLARHKESLLDNGARPWEVVEIFRHRLRATSRQPTNWDADNYGAGILQIDKLLNEKLPALSTLRRTITHAYHEKPTPASWDLGVREAVHYLWKTLVRKVTPGPESGITDAVLTERARIAMRALTGQQPQELLESYSAEGFSKADEIARSYFESYQ